MYGFPRGARNPAARRVAHTLQFRTAIRTAGDPMHYNERSRTFNFLTGFLVGAILGAILALILAPESGRRTRERFLDAVTDAGRDLGASWDGAADGFRKTILSARRGVRS
jgi:hypothetical protein